MRINSCNMSGAQVPPPAVSELWNLCNFASTVEMEEGFSMQCGRDRLFLEIGSGASLLAMAARHMPADLLTKARQCTN